MRKLVCGLVVGLLILIGCMRAPVKRFHYVSVPGYSVLPLRVYHVWVDKTFSVEDRRCILDAVNQWNYSLNGYVKIEVESYSFDMEVSIIERVMRGDGWIVLKIESRNPLVVARDGAPVRGVQYYTLAWVNKIGGYKMYMVRDRICQECVTGVALHEIGHLLGAEHDSVLLMQPHYNGAEYRCVDYLAVKRVAVYQHLDVSKLNYCKYE